jgi:hypothetical protein
MRVAGFGGGGIAGPPSSTVTPATDGISGIESDRSLERGDIAAGIGTSIVRSSVPAGTSGSVTPSNAAVRSGAGEIVGSHTAGNASSAAAPCGARFVSFAGSPGAVCGALATGDEPVGGGAVASPTSAPAHDHVHAQSHVQVSGVPVPALVEIVDALPQRVKVHVQIQGSPEGSRKSGELVVSSCVRSVGRGVAGESPPDAPGLDSADPALWPAVSEQPHSQNHSHDHTSDPGLPVSEEDELALPSQSTVRFQAQFHGAPLSCEAD